MFTRNGILSEFRRLCDRVDKAERHEYVTEDGERMVGLIGMDDAIRMRDTYRERADVVLDHFNKTEKQKQRAAAGAR